MVETYLESYLLDLCNVSKVPFTQWRNKASETRETFIWYVFLICKMGQKSSIRRKVVIDRQNFSSLLGYKICFVSCIYQFIVNFQQLSG